VRNEHDEELAVCAVFGVSASRRNGSAEERHAAELGLEVGQARAAAAVALWIAALGHEAGDHAVEAQAIVETLANKGLHSLDMLRCEVRSHLDHDLAAVR